MKQWTKLKLHNILPNNSKSYSHFQYFLVPIQRQVVGEVEPQTSSLEQLVPPFRLTESANGSNGFMLVGNSGETESLSHHLRVINNIIYAYVQYRQ